MMDMSASGLLAFQIDQKGMHNFRWGKDNPAAVVFHSTEQVFGQKLEESVPMVNMFATVVDSLGLSMPDGAKGIPIRCMQSGSLTV